MRARPRFLLLRRSTGGLLALWLVALQLPVAFPVGGPSGKDRSIPFPCMDRVCGCLSWAQCWKRCCCTTKEERIAFAKALKITIPDEDDEQVAAAKPKPVSKVACCANVGGAACHSKMSRSKSAEPQGDSVILSSVLRCRGLAMLLMQFAGVVATPAQERPKPPVVVDGRTPVMNDLLVSVEVSPPTPPPRLLAAVISH